jgi:cell shape-determining protein MreC
MLFNPTRAPSRKLQEELELLKMKLAAAERELAQMQELKDEIERLKALLREKDKKKPAAPWPEGSTIRRS